MLRKIVHKLDLFTRSYKDARSTKHKIYESCFVSIIPNINFSPDFKRMLWRFELVLKYKFLFFRGKITMVLKLKWQK